MRIKSMCFRLLRNRSKTGSEFAGILCLYYMRGIENARRGNFNRDAKRTNVYSGIFNNETHIYHLSQKVAGRPLLMTAQ